jgi:hypothetical protein
MTAREIINQIAAGREYKDLCKNIAKGHELYEDLFQELIIILCEYDSVKLEELYAKGQIKWFIVKIIKNQFQSTTSPFYKKYRAFADRSSDQEVHAPTEEPEDNEVLNLVQCETEKISFTDKNDWYDTRMFQLYLQEGSLRKLSAKTGISRTAISYAIDNFKKNIYKKLDEKEEFMSKRFFSIELSDEAKEQIFQTAQLTNVKPDQVIEERIKAINRMFSLKKNIVPQKPAQLSLF